MARIQIPARRATPSIKRIYVENPAKGLNNVVSDSLIDQREASSLLNISFNESGIITKRNGFSSVPGALTAPQGLSSFYTETSRQLLCVDAGILKKYIGSSWSPVSTTVTFDAARPYTDATQAGNRVFYWDRSNGGAVYDGNSLTRPGTIPKGAFSIYNNGLHIASGVPGQGSRVYFAAGGKPDVFTRDGTGKPSGTQAGDGWPDNATDVPGATTFTGTNATFTIDVSKNDGYRVTGLAISQGDIIIFKENAIYQLTFGEASADSTSAKISVITKSIGCIGHRTIQYVENDIMFMSDRGVYTLGAQENYYDVLRTNEVSARIRQTIQGITPAGYERIHSLYARDNYMLCAPVGSQKINRVLPYDQRYQAWSIWDTIAPIDMMEFVDDNNAKHIYFIQDTGAATTLKEIIVGQFNDQGQAINSYWESGALDANSIDITKRFIDLGLIFRQLNGSLTVNILTDGNVLLKSATISTLSSGGIGASQVGLEWIGGNIISSSTVPVTNEPWRFVVKRNSRTLKFRVANANVNENFGVLGYIIGYYPYGYYKFDSSRKVF